MWIESFHLVRVLVRIKQGHRRETGGSIVGTWLRLICFFRAPGSGDSDVRMNSSTVPLEILFPRRSVLAD
jgi:hypothetical protein